MAVTQRDAADFQNRQRQRESDAAQRVALQLACGVDLDSALGSAGGQRAQLVRRLDRALRCERIRGLRRHWRYDLNRHIALKQVLDRLRQGAGD